MMIFKLYKGDKMIMEKKHFYPIKSYLKSTLNMKNLMFLTYIECLETANKNDYRLEIKK